MPADPEPRAWVSGPQESFFAGCQAWASGDWGEARRHWLQALAQDPGMAPAHANLALGHDAAGDMRLADDHYRLALTLDPSLATVWSNYGAFLSEHMRLTQAHSAYQTALRLDPDLVSAWSNLAAWQFAAGQDEAAEQSARRALALQPEHPKARLHLAHVLLRQGHWPEGWAHFEARGWYQGFAQVLPMPRWHGESIEGQRLLLCSEAGHGDAIQFIRYARELRRMNPSRLGVLCHAALKPLFAQLPELDVVLSFEDDVSASDWDGWFPLMSAPGWCGTTVTHMPGVLPYLRTNPAAKARWQGRLPDAKKRVGLVWKGNPDFENDAQRSLPGLQTLVPLLDWGNLEAGVQFVSLQNGLGVGDSCQPVASRVLDVSHHLTDFAETAALIGCLDHVVSVDTAVAHLAGALGVPCSVLLPAYKTDWRWLRQRSDSPWYPQVMTLFRQTRSGDWTDAIEALRRHVQTLLTRA